MANVAEALDSLTLDEVFGIPGRTDVTPKGFERDLVAYQGAAFSASPKLPQSAYFRPPNRDPHIPGLYIVGAGTHPGAGVPGVVSSAKATVSVVREDYGLGNGQ